MKHDLTRYVMKAAGAIALAAVAAACASSGKQQTLSTPTTSSASPASAVATAAKSGAHTVRLTTVAQLPAGTFIESLAVRHDGSMLFSALNKKQLWYAPAPTGDASVQPLLLHTFTQDTMGIAEGAPDVFYLSTSNLYTTHDSSLWRVDMRGWQPGTTVPVAKVVDFGNSRALCLNGTLALSPRVLLIADCIGAKIWRIDLSADGSTASASVWLKDKTMQVVDTHLGSGQPGVNGVRYDDKTHFLYYTSTAQELFMRVAVNPATLNPAGAPQLVATGMMGDDFCIDENLGVAYVTTHRQNTIERVVLNARQSLETLAGKPLDLQLVGPSSCEWLRGPHDYGSTAYITTDGGFTSPPPDHIVRPARILRAVFN
jgi:hypothetical protein